jgi:hypothetical protein
MLVIGVRYVFSNIQCICLSNLKHSKDTAMADIRGAVQCGEKLHGGCACITDFFFLSRFNNSVLGLFSNSVISGVNY